MRTSLHHEKNCHTGGRTMATGDDDDDEDDDGDGATGDEVDDDGDNDDYGDGRRR